MVEVQKGRKPKLPPQGYFAACTVYVGLDLDYREMEGLTPFSGKMVDHSAFGKNSAYDWGHNLELALRHGFKPLFRSRKVEHHRLFRKGVLYDFTRNRRLYRRRSIGEAIFVGI